MFEKLLKTLVITGFFGLSPLLGLSPLSAQAASSDWQDVDGAQIRLHAAPISAPSSLQNSAQDANWGVAIEIKLQEGWKTYWKNPGFSGVPPLFNWQNSKNIAPNPNIEFPTPGLYKDVSGKVIGYKHHVVFLSQIAALDKEKPITLDVTAQLGICSDICVPVKVDLKLDDVDPNADVASHHAEALEIFEKNLDKLPQAKSETLGLRSIKAMPDKAGFLKIVAKIPKTAKNIHLLPSGADGWYLFPAKLLSRNGEAAEFELDINDIPKDGDPKITPIEYTLIADGVGISKTLKAQ